MGKRMMWHLVTAKWQVWIYVEMLSLHGKSCEYQWSRTCSLSCIASCQTTCNTSMTANFSGLSWVKHRLLYCRAVHNCSTAEGRQAEILFWTLWWLCWAPRLTRTSRSSWSCLLYKTDHVQWCVQSTTARCKSAEGVHWYWHPLYTGWRSEVNSMPHQLSETMQKGVSTSKYSILILNTQRNESRTYHACI